MSRPKLLILGIATQRMIAKLEKVFDVITASGAGRYAALSAHGFEIE